MRNPKYRLCAFELGISTWIVKDGDQVIGFVDCGPYRGGNLQDAGEVYAIYVLKQYYQCGVGSMLMEAALAEMRSFRRTAVWVLKDNERAIGFYARWGFYTDGQEQIITLGTPVRVQRMVREIV